MSLSMTLSDWKRPILTADLSTYARTVLSVFLYCVTLNCFTTGTALTQLRSAIRPFGRKSVNNTIVIVTVR